MERSRRYGTRSEAATWCLGQPPHTVQAGEVICPVCGMLVESALLGAYQVRQLLGSGRSGAAYLAVHQRRSQPVVMKLFAPEQATVNLWEAACREARVMTALHYASSLPVFSCAPWHPKRLPDGLKTFHELMTSATGRDAYLLTLCQYVLGSLSQFLVNPAIDETQYIGSDQTKARLEWLENLIQQMGAVLSIAHEHGIVHGALVPGNILLDKQGHLWVADFGLARLHPPPQPYLAPELYAASRASLQMRNMVSFWSAVTPASDQYNLAVLCYQLFTRTLPPHEYERVLPVLQHATDQNPAGRFANIAAFVSELLVQISRKRANYLARDSGVRGEGYQRRLSSNEKGSSSWRSTDSLAASSDRSQTEDWEKTGDKLFIAQQYAAAVQAYQRVLELNPAKVTIWLALGDAYLAQQHYTEAFTAYDQAVKLTPGDPLAWTNRGTALEGLGRRREASDSYERAVQLNSRGKML